MLVQTILNCLLLLELLIVTLAAFYIAGRFWLSLKTRCWRERVRMARWAYVYLYAGLGSMTFVLIAPWLRTTLTGWLNHGPLLADGSLALFVIMALLFVVMMRSRPVAIGELRKALLFPPWWVAVLLAQAFVGGYWLCFPSTWKALVPIDHAVLGSSLMALITQVLTVALVAGLTYWDRLRERHRNEDSQAASPNDSSQPTSDALDDWYANDAPIECADDDKFGHPPIAERIANRLATSGELPAIAVIGRFGSGKSSVRNLTIQALKKEHPSVHVVCISAWPYESASALVTGILERVVAELADIAGWEESSEPPKFSLKSCSPR